MPHRLAPNNPTMDRQPRRTRIAFFLTALLGLTLSGVWANRARADAYAFQTFGSASLRPAVWVDRTWFDSVRGRSVPVRIYYPKATSQDADVDAAPEKLPLIVFSTGLGRSRDECAYLGRHWAGCGYVVVHVQHKGSDAETRQGTLRPRKELQQAFYSSQNVRNRPIDVIFAIDQLEQMQRNDQSPGNRCDMTRIGVAGHDFGAQTVLGLAGQVLPGQIAFDEPRVKAVLAMSSPVPLGQVPLDLAYENVAKPCLHITGTADNSIVGTTQASQRRLPFDHTFGADQYLVTFYGADHMVYAGHLRAANGTHDAMYQHRIAECSAVFWDAYLKAIPGAKAWLTGDGMRDRLQTTARVERKLADDRTAER